MVSLATEYTGVKENKHKVVHLIVSDNEVGDKEQVVKELFYALTRPVKRISA